MTTSSTQSFILYTFINILVSWSRFMEVLPYNSYETIRTVFILSVILLRSYFNSSKFLYSFILVLSKSIVSYSSLVLCFFIQKNLSMNNLLSLFYETMNMFKILSKKCYPVYKFIRYITLKNMFHFISMLFIILFNISMATYFFYIFLKNIMRNSPPNINLCNIIP